MGASFRQPLSTLARTATTSFAALAIALVCAPVSAQFVIEEEAPAAKPVATASNPQAKLQAYLDAGEFGPAIELANKANAADRSAMMRSVTLAQIQAGENTGALMSVRQDDGNGSATDAAAATNKGGGANFAELIQLIQTQTDGLWADIDGDGGTMSQFTSGVMADPTALLPLLARVDTEGRLASLGLKARKANLNAEMAQPSKMRMVSFKRLQAAVEQNLQGRHTDP